MFEKSDRYVGIGFVLLGIICFYSATQWPMSFASDPAGPGAIPKILSAGLVVLGLILAIGGFLTKKKPEEKLVTRQELVLTLIMTGICVAYIILLPIIGYVIATPLLIAAILFTVGSRKWTTLVFVSLGASLVLFVLFYSLLRVNLPLGFMKNMLRWVPRL